MKLNEPKQVLDNLVKAGKPLVEVSIHLTEDADAESIIRDLNKLADNFEASLSGWYAITGKKDTITADATPEALLKLFGWHVRRAQARKWNSEKRTHEEVLEGVYY